MVKIKSKNKKIILNNRAFTLTELIAVIVVLSLLITASVAIFINVRKSVLEKEYSNLVVYLETRAVEFANKTGVTTISVEDLIKEGYIKPDDESDIYDPRNNTSMNCYLIKMDYKDGEYVAKLSEKLEDQEGKCSKYNRSTRYNICRILADGTCEQIKDDEWFNDNVKLGVSSGNQLLIGNIEYKWSTNTGVTSKESIVETDVKLVGRINYKCEVTGTDENGEEVNGVAVSTIKIDKEAPVINDVKMDTNWSTSKELEIVANDGMGSGIGGYALINLNNLKNEDKENLDTLCNKVEYGANKKIEVNSIAKYIACVKDKVGHVSQKFQIEVNTIDNEPPKIRAIKPNNQIYMGINKMVKDEYFEVDYSASGGTTKCNYETTNGLNVGKYVLTCTATGGNGLTASASTNLEVIAYTPSTPVIETRYENANGSIYSGAWTNKAVYVSITPSKENDFVGTYQYKIGTGSWQDPSDLKMDGANGSFTYTREVENTIYVRACNGDKCSGVSNGKVIKIDTTSPVCSLSVTASGVSIGSKSSDVSKSGVNNSINPEYTNSRKSLAVGTFYGHVYDKAGNTGICKSEIVNGTLYYNQTTTTCNESYVNHPIKYYTRTSYYCNREQTGTKNSCSSGTYPNTGDYCYTYTSGSSFNGCSSGTYSNGTCTKTKQSSCASGWKKSGTNAAKYKCSANNCPSYTTSTTCNNTKGCNWTNRTCHASTSSGGTSNCSGFGGSVSGKVCYKYNQTSCPSGWNKTLTTAETYTCTKPADACASGWTSCSWCNQSKCKKSTGKVTKTPIYSYSFDSGSNEYNQTDCSTNSIDCNETNYKKTKVSCSPSSSVDDYYYEYSASSSQKSGLASCTPSTGYSSCSGSYKNSQTNQKNKTNVACAIGGYNCPSGYSKVGNSYCYK